MKNCQINQERPWRELEAKNYFQRQHRTKYLRKTPVFI